MIKLQKTEPVIHEVLTDCFNDKEMTIYNQRDGQAVPQPSVRVEEIPTLSEIYNEDYPPVYFDFDDETPYEGRESLNKRIRIYKKGDITNLKVDAVVNPVQTDLLKPPIGLCEQMFHKGGPILKQACLDHAVCPVGEAFITEGYELPAQYVIHTAGPSPNCGVKDQERLDCLKQSYLACLSIIKERRFTSVGIPCLGTGRGGVNLQDGVKIAVTTSREWLETAENNTLEHLVFCLFVNSQYETVMKEMLRCFPRGTDAAGTDLEQLDQVPDTILNPPAWIFRTHIFCLKYNTKARSKISHHFHNLVNYCNKELCPTDTGIDRYYNCAVFSLTSDRVYRCIILHSNALNMIEVQILKFCHENREIDENIKIGLDSAIMDYLDTYLVNVTPFEKYIRCEESTWRSKYGLWACKQLQLTVAREIPCDHGNNMTETHMIRPKELLDQWPVFDVERNRSRYSLGAEGSHPNPRLSKEPIEHCEPQSAENSHQFSTLDDMSSSRCTLENTAIKAEAKSENNSRTAALKAGETLTQFTGTGRPEMHAKGPRTFNDRGSGATGNDFGDLGYNFLSLTECLGTDVRPKEYNIPNQHNIRRSEETNEFPRNNAASWPSKILSGFQSLFSSKSDRPGKSAVQNILNTSRKTNKATETSYGSVSCNQAMQDMNCTDDISLQKDTSFKEKSTFDTSNLFDHSHILREETTEITENPLNDLKVELPNGGKLEPSAVASEESFKNSTLSYIDSRFPSKSDVVTHRRPSDKDLLEIAEVLGLKHEELGIRLGLSQSTIERCKGENPHNLKMQGYYILRTWFRKYNASLDELFREMDQCDIDTYDLNVKFRTM